jgi:hypothetical protein
LTSAALPVRQRIIISFNIITIINIGLLAACVALVLYYVLSANGLAASNYRVSSIRDDLARATSQQTELILAASKLESIESVSAFATTHQMVIAKDISYFFENGSVALVR